MRKVTYGAACSLDGFIAGPNGEADWLHFTKDAQAIMADYWPRIDTLLIGRKTWEVANAAAQSGGGGGGDMMAGITSYVFSRTLTHIPPSSGQLVREDAGEFVRELKRKKGKEICVFGGGDLARSLFAADLVDEVGLNIHPILLGNGIPLFKDAGRIKLRLVENRTIEGGCVYMMYKVVHPRRAAAGEGTSEAVLAGSGS